MRDILGEHAESVAEANKTMLADLEALRGQVERETMSAMKELRRTLVEVSQTLDEATRTARGSIEAMVKNAAIAASDALTRNLMTAAASEAGLRSTLGARLTFLETGELPVPPRATEPAPPEIPDGDEIMRAA